MMQIPKDETLGQVTGITRLEGKEESTVQRNFTLINEQLASAKQVSSCLRAAAAKTITSTTTRSGIALTQEQLDAAGRVLDLLKSGERTVAMDGSAGTGKTLLTGYFVRHWGAPTVTATTNKAAFLLSSKLERDWGIECEVQTVYGAAFTPRLKPAAEPIALWLTHDIKPSPIQLANFSNEFRVPSERMHQPDARELIMGGQRSAAWAAMGVNNFMSLVAGWNPRPYAGGTVVVDEASMLPGEHLDALRKIFDRVLIVGDAKQLPPIDAEPAFHLCRARVSLSTIHRQAENSSVLEAAVALYNGTLSISEALPNYHGTMPTQMLLDGSAVCLTYRNETRVRVCQRIRAAAGRTGKAVRGDLIVMRANDGEFCTNQIVKVIDAYKDHLVVVDPLRPKKSPVTFIGWDQDTPTETRPRGSTPYRFAYAMTVHTAQGSEWPIVFVHSNDFPFRSTEEQRRSWSYTAVTRAKQTAYQFSA
jgi:hypothetical protein